MKSPITITMKLVLNTDEELDDFARMMAVLAHNGYGEMVQGMLDEFNATASRLGFNHPPLMVPDHLRRQS